MHAIFAIEPKSINNWQDLRYILEKFGYNKGILIARYPKRWMRLVMEECRANNVSDIDLSRIEEKLRQAKSKQAVKLNLPFDPELEWTHNVKKKDIQEEITATLVYQPDNHPNFFCVKDVCESVFDGKREIQVKQTATELAQASKHILYSSSRIAIIDPYLRASTNSAKTINKMVDICIESGHQLEEIVIYTKIPDDYINIETCKKNYTTHLAHSLKKGINFNINYISNNYDNDFHARYIFSIHAGLRYDRGFNEPSAHDRREHLTDIICLEHDMIETLSEQYLNDNSAISTISFTL